MPMSDFRLHTSQKSWQKVFGVMGISHLGSYVLTVNDTYMYASTRGPWIYSLLMVLSLFTRVFSISRDHRIGCIYRSHHDVCRGASMCKSPSAHTLYISKMAWLSFLSVPMRSLCPIQVSFLACIYFTMSKILHFGDTSWCGVFRISHSLFICALVPFSFFIASGLSFHAPDPCTMMLHTLDLYNRSRRLKCRWLSFQRCLSLSNPHRALAILVWMSLSCPPSACMIDPSWKQFHILRQ